MASEGSALLGMIRDSIVAPRSSAERVLALRPAPTELMLGVVLVATLDALLAGVTGVGVIIIPDGADGLGQVLSPFAHAAMLAMLLLVFASAFQAGGQVLGGQGRFSESLLVVVWLEVVSLAIQVVQAFVMKLVPPLEMSAAIAGGLLLLWCLLNFMRALHRFTGLGRTIGAVLLASIGAALALSFLLALLGIGVPSDV